jgi:uncharacterized protein YceK
MRWLVVALAAVLLSGCSSISADSSGGEPIPRRDANDLATARAAAGLDQMTPTPRTAAPTPTATVAPLADATATPAIPTRTTGLASDAIYYDTLLLPDDITTEWTFGGFDGLGVASFCDAAAIEDTYSPIGWAYGSYSASGGQWAEQWVVRLTASDAEAAMEYARTSLTCEEYSPVDWSDAPSHWTFQPIDAPLVGDDVHAMQVTVTYENPIYTPLVGTIVFARKGEYDVTLMHYGFSIDQSLTGHMMEVAMLRLDLVNDSSV